ncbi:flagellar filament capping protein FliD [Nocardioides nematodiphilus]|uniref:flagellar filament capping protein FliD n=1 Tax=Nocardioides nematodiphilus TaxID=2849669 RepID=UPI001CD96A6D|nr:flagellar filament capping protein FliD [Nocardioides nematodiphilus]MCA1984227.1 flagellar filament capping protein FliD [Nocardioides nematodiphilus]
MPAIQFSGLSGLDTSAIIKQLMAAESVPQTKLKNTVAQEQAQVSALKSINSALSSLSTSAASFSTGSTWSQKTATSSNSAITVNASSSAVASSVSVVVADTATAASASFNTTTTANTNFTIKDGQGKTLAAFDSGTGSLTDIARGINATSSKSNLSAVIIQGKDASGNATPVLQLTSLKTGKASDFTISATDGVSGDLFAPAAYTAAKQAHVTVNNVDIYNDSNTIEITPGVKITVAPGTAAGTTATVGVVDDGNSRVTAMKAFVGQLNDLLNSINTATAYGQVTNGTTSGGGVLPGDSTLRSVATDVISSVLTPINGRSLMGLGVSVDRYGSFSFDPTTFNKAYDADPEAVQAALVGTGNNIDGTPKSDNFASRIQKAADQAAYSRSGASSPFMKGPMAYQDGYLTSYIKGMSSEIDGLNDDIAAWDDRLAAKQANFETVYNNLTTVLSKLQAQQSWISSQLSSLDSGWQQNNN